MLPFQINFDCHQNTLYDGVVILTFWQRGNIINYNIKYFTILLVENKFKKQFSYHVLTLV